MEIRIISVTPELGSLAQGLITYILPVPPTFTFAKEKNEKEYRFTFSDLLIAPIKGLLGEFPDGIVA